MVAWGHGMGGGKDRLQGCMNKYLGVLDVLIILILIVVSWYLHMSNSLNYNTKYMIYYIAITYW